MLDPAAVAMRHEQANLVAPEPPRLRRLVRLELRRKNELRQTGRRPAGAGLAGAMRRRRRADRYYRDRCERRHETSSCCNAAVICCAEKRPKDAVSSSTR